MFAKQINFFLWNKKCSGGELMIMYTLIGTKISLENIIFIQFGSHQWIQIYLGKAFCDFLGKYLSYRQIRYLFLHPHFQSFHMRISDIYSDQLNSWHKTRPDFELFIWPIRKHFCSWEFLCFFHQISSLRGLVWSIKRHFNIISKNGCQSMDSF